MIRRFVLGPKCARTSVWLGVLWMVGCQVYDPSLLEQGAQRASVRGRPPADLADAAMPEPDAGMELAASSCGNGLVEEGEACDIALARGTSGACPDGCSGGQGCTRYELEGVDCEAHCVARVRDEPVPDDGCCPAGLDFYQDRDCPARCGNAQLEPGELCDPAATCPTPPACRRTDVCQSAVYSGAADSCNAQCELTTIQSCVDNDGCCPPGCDRASDTDCPGECPEGATCRVAPLPPPFECSTQHGGSACRACDCEHCGPEASACWAATAEDSVLCAAAVDCSEEHACTTDECYCGSATVDSCQEQPLGACVMEWEAAARSNSPPLVFYFAGNTSFTLGRATALLDCRARNCAKECGLER